MLFGLALARPAARHLGFMPLEALTASASGAKRRAVLVLAGTSARSTVAERDRPSA